MSKKRDLRLHASWLLASPLALILLVLAVSSAAAHHSPGHLSDPSVSPREVAAGGTVVLAVTFTDDTGAAPRAVTVSVDGAASSMTADADSFKTGVRYETRVAPAAGRHAIVFSVTDATGDREFLAAGYVQVKGSDGPGPSADPTAAPTRSPRPEPTARCTPAVTPAGGGRGTGGTDKSDTGDGPGGATPAPAVTPAADATPVPGSTPAPDAASPDPTNAGQTEWPGTGTTSGSGVGKPAGPEGPISTADPSPGDGRTMGPATGLTDENNVAGGDVEESQGAILPVDGQSRIDLLARYHASLPTMLVEMVPTIVTATTGGLAWAAFVIFGKRRRDGENSEPDPLLATAAATGVETGAAQGLRAVDESQLPRWRRPSLQQVRRTDPLRVVADAPTMSFAKAGVRPLESYERRQIRYRLVRLLNCPDEVRASEIGVLDRGDEVQLLERHGVYWRVLCPDGRTGWVHRMTLAAPASESASEAVEPEIRLALEPPCEPVETPVAPAAAAPAENVDGLLEAYMRARSDVLHSAGEVEAVGFEAGPIVEAPVEPVEPVEPAQPAEATEPVEPETSEIEPAPATAPGRAATPAPAMGLSVAALARDYLERAGFAVVSPETAAQPAVGPLVEPVIEPAVEVPAEPAIEPVAGPAVDAATTPAVPAPSSDAAPSAERERADGRYSGRKSAGSRKASTESRPGTRSRRPSR